MTVVANINPGDVGFVHDPASFPSPNWWIRFAESRKYGKITGPLSPAYWNHCFLVTADAIIEATPQGVVRSSVDEYVNRDHVLVTPKYQSVSFRDRAVEAAESSVGQRYGYSFIFADALSLVFNSALRIGFIKHHTCSGALARWLTVGGIDMGDFEEWNSPADDWSVLHAA